MKIIFMGTSEFALQALSGLYNSDHEILAVYTKHPEKKGGRTMFSPIQKLAMQLNMNIETPISFKDPINVQNLQNYHADIIVVAAYGLILTKQVLSSAKYGAINIHPSKLPRWRGAAPIQRTIFSGDEESAVCIIQMDEGVDTGDILLQENFALNPETTTHDLMESSSKIASRLLLLALKQIENGTIEGTKQSSYGATYAVKLLKEEEQIKWNETGVEIDRRVRALAPKPGAYFIYNKEIIKVYKIKYIEQKHKFNLGEIIDDAFGIACKNAIIYPELLQRQGRKMIYKDAFLRGFKIEKGLVLE